MKKILKEKKYKMGNNDINKIASGNLGNCRYIKKIMIWIWKN